MKYPRVGCQCYDFRLQINHVSPLFFGIYSYWTIWWEIYDLQVHLTIRTLPELPAGAKYRCVFGGAEPIDAGVTPFGLTCPTPTILYRPKISEGQDHVYVPLSVRSSETNKDFVSRNFAYFDCGSHKKCSDCVRSNWACNWCIYQNECIHNATECHGGTIISGEKVSYMKYFSAFSRI